MFLHNEYTQGFPKNLLNNNFLPITPKVVSRVLERLTSCQEVLPALLAVDIFSDFEYYIAFI